MLVSRWGNSLGVWLPRALVDNLGLKPGDTIALAHQIASGEFLHSDRFPGGPSPVVSLQPRLRRCAVRLPR